MANPVEQAPAKPGVLAQRVLTALIQSASRPLSEVADEVLVEASPDLRDAALAALLRAVQRWRIPKGKNGTDAAGQDPSLAERVLIRKNLLKRAQVLVKTRGRKLDFPVPPDKLGALFGELTQTIEEPCREFLAAVCEALEVGREGEFLSSYSLFLNGAPLFQKSPRSAAWARRVIRWIFRDLEVRFVRLEPPEVCREVPAGRAREEFFRRWHLADVDEPGLAHLVEEQLDRWLLENGLAGPGWPPPDHEEQKKIVGDFWERRRAEEAPPAGATDGDRRAPKPAEEVCALRDQLADLPSLRLSLGQREAELAALRDERDRLREESKQLRNESARLRTAARQSPGDREVEIAALRDDQDRLRVEAVRSQKEFALPQAEAARVKESGSPDWVAAEFRELRALLTLVDEKYPLDSLNELVVAGRELEPPVTLRQFVSHLFFALRKRGLGYYPDRDEFDLSYNESALYDCLGFEVAPGATVRVGVRSKGWALRNGRTLIPIRRARIERA